MIWTRIQRIAIDAFVFAWQNPLIVAGIVVLLITLVIIAQVNSCRDRRTEKKIDGIRTTIVEKKIEANIAANEVKQNEQNSNSTLRDFNRAIGTDSNKFSGANIDDRFCRRYPLDSSCAEWRRLRGSAR